MGAKRGDLLGGPCAPPTAECSNERGATQAGPAGVESDGFGEPGRSNGGYGGLGGTVRGVAGENRHGKIIQGKHAFVWKPGMVVRAASALPCREDAEFTLQIGIAAPQVAPSFSREPAQGKRGADARGCASGGRIRCHAEGMVGETQLPSGGNRPPPGARAGATRESMEAEVCCPRRVGREGPKAQVPQVARRQASGVIPLLLVPRIVHL
jgi:hypothetical protein